jgi:transposase
MKAERRGRQTRFTAEQKARAVALIDEGLTYRQVGDMYGVWANTIARWCNPYKEEVYNAAKRAKAREKAAPKREAREANIRECKEMYAQGATIMQMMQRFGVWNSTICGWLGLPNGNPGRYRDRDAVRKAARIAARAAAKKHAAAVNNCDNGENKCLSV